MIRTVPRRFDLLLLVRGVAALTVLFWHVDGYKATALPVLNLPGTVAVWLFFGISGYVIAHGFVHGRYAHTLGGVASFFRNRFLRIYPLFLLISLLALGTIWMHTETMPIGWADVPGDFLGARFNQDYRLIGVFWTLGIEMQFYALAPLLALPLLCRRTIGVATLMAVYCVTVTAYQYAVLFHGWSFDGRNIVTNLPHFLVGMIGCRIVSGERIVIPSRLTLTAAFLMLGYCSWIYQVAPPQFWSMGGLVLVDCVILLLIVSHARLEARPTPRTPVYRLFAILGVLSYGIYAWHGYFLAAWPWTRDALFSLTMLSIACAVVSYRLLEVHALRLKRRRAPMRFERRAA